MSEIKVYYMETKKPILFPDTSKLQFGCCLIWNLNGLYKIISNEQLSNLAQLTVDVAKQPSLNKPPDFGFHWDEGTDLDPKIAKLLLGQQ